MLAVSVQEMRRLEGASEVPLEELMRTAGINAAMEFLDFAQTQLPPRHRRRFAVIAGKGNNGGDALCVAKYLHSHGQDVAVFSTVKLSDYSGTATSQAQNFPTAIPFTTIDDALPECALVPGTVIIDGLLGIGLNGTPRGVSANIIAQINASDLPVLSIDTPSGLDCDSGTGQLAIHATMTVTMAAPKRGFFCNDGPSCIGILRVVPIGLTQNVLATAQGETEAFLAQDAVKLLKIRNADSHKNTFGHCLCIAGSGTYYGAPFLAAEGALRTGAGLVTLAIPFVALRRSGPASLIIAPVGDKDTDHFATSHISDIQNLAKRSTAILYGPGTGSEVKTDFLRAILELDQPTVIDADGIRLLATSKDILPLLRTRKNPVILTPHPGEMSALLKGLDLEHPLQGTSRECQAKEASASCNAFIVLKGHQTIVASPDGRTSINTGGGPELATAGTGDVLAGIITALLAQNYNAFDAARLGAFIHGLAGELYPHADASMIADDLLALISQALKEISPLA